MNTSRPGPTHSTKAKKSKVKPTDKLPESFRPRCWALFKHELEWNTKNKKWEQHKVTYSPKTLCRFKWRKKGGHWEANKHLFGTFEEVVNAYGENPHLFDGYGYILEPDVPVPGTKDLYWIVTDLDKCRNPKLGDVERWAMEIIKAHNTFTELSPSGEGVHLIGVGRKEPGSKTVFYMDKHRIENYGGNVGARRFMTFTGVPLDGYEKSIGHEDVQQWIDENVPIKESKRKGPTLGYEDLGPEILDDVKSEIVRICERIKHEDRGEAFKKLYCKGDSSLYEGKNSPYPSRSEAEIELLNILAWATTYLFEDEDERKQSIKEIFVASAFYRNNHRDQWDREGYLDEQIDKAIADCTSGYTGKPKEQMLRKLEALRIDYDWAEGGKDKPNVRAAYAAHIALAYDHGRYVRAGEVVPGPRGELYPIPEAGVLVHSPVRGISLFSGVLPSIQEIPSIREENAKEYRDYRNITRLNDKLEEMGLIWRIYRGVSWGTASLYLLPKSVVDSHEFSSLFSSNTHNQEPQSSFCYIPNNQFSNNLFKEDKEDRRRSGSGLCVFGENILLTERLNWTQDKYTPKQRFVIEQVYWGRRTYKELEEFFADTPKNLKYKVINPLVKQGILSETDQGYRVNVEAVHQVFVESGGEELLNREIEEVESERTNHQQRLKELGKEYDPVAIQDWAAESDKERIEAALRGGLPFSDLSFWEAMQAMQAWTRLGEEQMKAAFQ